MGMNSRWNAAFKQTNKMDSRDVLMKCGTLLSFPRSSWSLYQRGVQIITIKVIDRYSGAKLDLASRFNMQRIKYPGMLTGFRCLYSSNLNISWWTKEGQRDIKWNMQRQNSIKREVVGGGKKIKKKTEPCRKSQVKNRGGGHALTQDWHTIHGSWFGFFNRLIFVCELRPRHPVLSLLLL